MIYCLCLIIFIIKTLDPLGTGFIELVHETRKGFMLEIGYFWKRLNLVIHCLINDLFNEGKEYLTTKYINKGNRYFL